MIIGSSLIFILLITVLGAVMLRRTVGTIGLRVHHRKLQRILGGYIFILLLAALIVYMLPSENFAKREELSEKEITRAMQISKNFHDALARGKVNQVAGVNVNGQWSFEYAGNQVAVVDKNEFGGSWIMAERKDIDDNKIEVISYVTPSIIEGIDLTDKVESPKVSLEGNTLKIQPAHLEVKFVEFNKDFTTVQFWGKKVTDSSYADQGFRDVMGQQLIYLRIPKDVEVFSKDYRISFVNE